MDPIMLLFVIGLTLAAKSAIDHTRDGYRKSRDAAVKAAEKKAAPGTLSKSRRAVVAGKHAQGWWTSELLHGFPVTRTGWHAGWLAHRAAADHGKAIREEARTTHLEARASVLSGIREHRARQAEARKQIEGILSTEEAAKGKKAVKEAAGAVVLPFPDRPAPPLPADAVGKPGPGPYAPGPDAEPDDSDWLKPGEPRCELCGGTGRNAAGNDACPACRGFGSAPADPASPEAAADAICAACGNPGRPGDPVLDAPGALVHRSHATEQQAAYKAALIRADLATPSPNGNGAGPMAQQAAEVTYDQVVAEARRIADEAEQHVAELRNARISNMVEQLAAVLNDSGSLASLSEIDEALKQEMKAAQEVHDRAVAFRDQHIREHGGMAEAHQNAPVAGAEPEYYEG